MTPPPTTQNCGSPALIYGPDYYGFVLASRPRVLQIISIQWNPLSILLGITAGFILIALPISQQYGGTVMADISLALFGFWVTGWMVTMRESAELAKRLIEESCAKQKIRPGQLTPHADRGTSMSSKPVAFLLADLGVTKTHSRPHVSDYNP